MCLFLVKLADVQFEVLTFLELVVPEGGVTSDENLRVVRVRDGNMDTSADGVLDLLRSNELRLVPLPKVDRLLGVFGQRCQHFLLIGLGESTRDELILFVDLERDNNSSLLLASQIVHTTDWSLFSALTDSQPSLRLTDSEGSDAFRALNTCDVFLSFFFNVIEDDVVTSGVQHGVVVQEEDVAVHVSLQTRNEPWHQNDVAQLALLVSTGLLLTFFELLLAAGLADKLSGVDCFNNLVGLLHLF